MHACVRARTGMHARFAIPSSRFYVFLLILYEKIIMLHKARCVKKNGVGKGRRCRQKKKKKKKKKKLLLPVCVRALISVSLYIVLCLSSDKQGNP